MPRRNRLSLHQIATMGVAPRTGDGLDSEMAKSAGVRSLTVPAGGVLFVNKMSQSLGLGPCISPREARSLASEGDGPDLMACTGYGKYDPQFGVERDYCLIGHLAVLPIRGALWFEQWSTGWAIDALHEMADDPRIFAVLTDWDSGGGQANSDLVRAMDAVREKKPLHTIAHDDLCSMAYWAGSRADELVMTPSGVVGSIGTYVTAVDYTKYLEEIGIHVEVIKTGDRKAINAMGRKLNAGDIKFLQGFVDEHVQDFYEAVSERRGISVDAIRGLEAGFYGAATALKLKLVDRVVNYRDYLQELIDRYSGAATLTPYTRPEAPDSGEAPETTDSPVEDPEPPEAPEDSHDGDHPMDLKELQSKHPETYRLAMAAGRDEGIKTGRAEAAREASEAASKPADFAALNSAFGSFGTDGKLFVHQALEKNMSMAAAQTAWNTAQAAKITALSEQVTKLNSLVGDTNGAEPGFSAKGTDGAEPNSSNQGGGTAGKITPGAQAFVQSVRAAAAAQKIDLKSSTARGKLIGQCAASDPKGHEEWVSAGAPAIA